MKTSFISLFTLAFFTCMGAVSAQSLDMGTDRIRFGTGCGRSFIQNPNFNDFRLNIGYESYCFYPQTSQATVVINTSSGNIGLGTSNPSYRLHLTQNSAAKPGSSYWTVISDKRFKEDIRPFVEGMDLLRQLDPVRFRYKAESGMDSKEIYVGLIAQDLQKVAPYMVKPLLSEEGETEYLTVDLHALDFALINGMKELDAELTRLKDENELLHKRLESLEKQLGKDPARQKTEDRVGEMNTDFGIQKVSPVPSRGEVKVLFSLPERVKWATLKVSDLSGRPVWSQKLDPTAREAQLDLSKISQGTYLLSLKTDQQLFPPVKILINR